MSEPTLRMIDAGATHKWSTGYDRNGSHATGEYKEYTASLIDAFGEHGARTAAIEIYNAMTAAQEKL